MRLTALLLGTALLAACSSESNIDRMLRAEAKAPYKFDTGDIVRITVAGGYAQTYQVEDNGTIDVPPLGAVTVRGRSADQIEDDLTTRLSGLDAGARPTVEIAAYRPFFAMGEVQSTGRFDFVPGMTVQQAIDAAGGFTARADQRSVQVTRNISGEIATAGLKLSDKVLPGDTIYVKARSL